jgi:hypothetical protein
MKAIKPVTLIKVILLMHRYKDTTTIKIETNPLFFLLFLLQLSTLSSILFLNIRKAFIGCVLLFVNPFFIPQLLPLVKISKPIITIFILFNVSNTNEFMF